MSYKKVFRELFDIQFRIKSLKVDIDVLVMSLLYEYEVSEGLSL